MSHANTVKNSVPSEAAEETSLSTVASGCGDWCGCWWCNRHHRWFTRHYRGHGHWWHRWHGGGNGTAPDVNIDKEEAYWRDNHAHGKYFDTLIAYDNYAPAYRLGLMHSRYFWGVILMKSNRSLKPSGKASAAPRA